MSTQFFQRQADARTNTSWLVFLFVIAVIGIVGVSAVLGYAVAEYLLPSKQQIQIGEQITQTNPYAIALISGAVAAVVILCGSLYQIIALRSGGGSGVAESLGGRPLLADSATGDERRLLNVVEEMAIASGTPVPPVYLLDEDGINAFAAGYRPNDAVIGITRGAVNHLNRDQLQGVIAHEFSHILNGDMRINIRMIGILHGILLMALIGRMLLESLRYVGNRSSSRDSKGNGGIVVFLLVTGLSLLVIGGIGHFMGGLIKAAVCRQREYLADASAVQFTRNPGGIGGALKRIASLASHGRITHRNAATASHLFFSQAVFEGFSQLMATHPPLEKRILAIEPQWDGSFDDQAMPKRVTAASSASMGSKAGRKAATGGVSMAFAEAPHEADDLVPPVAVREAVEHVGAPEKAHRDYSASLLQNMDTKLRQAAGDPCTARALVFALLIDRNDQVARNQIKSIETLTHSSQLTGAAQRDSARLLAMTKRLLPYVQCAPEAMRLPLVDLALPSLRQMSRQQYQHFAVALQALIEADRQLSIFEWALSQVLKRNLRSQFVTVSEIRVLYSDLRKLGTPVSLLLTMLARVGHQEEEHLQVAFAAAAQHVADASAKLLPIEQCSLSQLEEALGYLRRTSERTRERLLQACTTCVASDHEVKVREAELLRGIADLLDCPMPPLVVTP